MKPSTRQPGKGKSPYQKYQKAPFQYSALYRQWREARDKGHSREAANLAREHSRVYGLTMPNWA